ncbi:MAG: AbrB/MazE/SpoVT family DNA-binding domain-containing protein [Deltaproteobacteria bacterium]|nr:AbrB/MazE/SpoVT family DNA-binding domain-containing protein [Deltaproteobacteria bacterium]
MLAKMTAKNQITIPKKILTKIGDVQYFEVEYKDGVVILKPVKIYHSNLEDIRMKIKKLGLSENSVEEAIKWARSK